VVDVRIAVPPAVFADGSPHGPGSKSLIGKLPYGVLSLRNVFGTFP